MGCGFLFARGFKSFNCTFELIQFSLRLSTDVSSFGWGLLNHFSCSAPIRNYDIPVSHLARTISMRCASAFDLGLDTCNF